MSRSRSGLVRFQAVCGADFSSRLVAWWGSGYGGFSHIDCLMSDGSLIGARDDVITVDGVAYPSGVQRRPAEYERWIRRAVISLVVEPHEATAWEYWLERQIGDQYDQDAIWGFLLGRRDHARGHWICSALAAGSLEAIGKLHRLPVPTCQVTPDAFRLIASTLGASSLEVGH